MNKERLCEVQPRSRGGRPPVAEKKIPLTTWVSEGEYERIRRLAQDESMSSVVRRLLILRLS